MFMWTVLFIFLFSSAFRVQESPTQVDLSTLLRAKDQALLDALAPGDHAPWDEAMSMDFVYVDENHEIMTRDDFLKQLQPLPVGASGNISMRTYQVVPNGDTAIVIHHDDETEHYFGSNLHAEYMMTETWQLLGKDWKLRIVHACAIPGEPAAVAVSHRQIDELTGTYRAGTLTYVLRRDGDRILGARSGRPEKELKAESRDVLFIPGQPRSHMVFLRDASGKVIAFADRRENRDLVWTRVN
jgi:hypothetical protein